MQVCFFPYLISIMNNTPVAPFVAVFIGAVAVFGLSLAGVKMLNVHHKNTCEEKSTHQVVHFRGFFGDEYACVDKRYL